MRKEIPVFDWDEKTEETQAPKADGFEKNVASIRDALKNRPTLQGYLTLVGELLDRGLLDEANEVADELAQWKKSKNYSSER